MTTDVGMFAFYLQFPPPCPRTVNVVLEFTVYGGESMNNGRRRRRRRSLRSYSITGAYQLKPICKLWMLRFLRMCGKRCEFIEAYGFEDEHLARKLGFSDCMEADDFQPAMARKELRQLYGEIEKSKEQIRPPKILVQNLRLLSRQISLSNCEQEILAFAVLAHTESELQSIMDRSLQVNSTRLPHVLATLLDLDIKEVSDALGKNSTIFGSGLLKNDHWDTVGDIRDFLVPLSDKFAIDLVTEKADMSTLFESAFRQAPRTTLNLGDFEHLATELEPVVAHARVALDTRRCGVNYLLYGAPGTGKTELSRVLSEELQVQNFEIVVSDENDQPIGTRDRACAFKSAQSYLKESRSLITFDEVDDLLNPMSNLLALFGGLGKSPSSSSKAWLNRVLEENAVPTIWIANNILGADNAVLRRFDRIIEVPVPPQQQRERVVKRMIPTADRELVRAVASSPDLAPAVLQRGVDFATVATRDVENRPWNKTMLDAINSTLRSQAIAPIKLDDPALLPETYDLSYINSDVDLKLLAEKLRLNPSARMCLYGPSGTGKSAFVRWLADDIGLSLERVNASDLLNPYVGGTEQNIQSVFANAERSGAILLIDEIDSFLSSRGGARRSWEVTMVNEFLAQLECFSGVIAVTTNFEQILDVAAFRRFDLKIKFSYLMDYQKTRLFQSYCSYLSVPLPSKDELQELQKLENLAPGDFAAIARRCRFSPIDSARELIEGLKAECSIKPHTRTRVGFC